MQSELKLTNVIIDANYLSSKINRKNITVKNEVFAAEIVAKYIITNKLVVVGRPASKELPDLFTKDKLFGFEVSRCEKDIDFRHIDATKEICGDNRDYKKCLQKLKNPNSAVAKANLKISYNGTKIDSTTNGTLCYSCDWMQDDYKTCLIKKLTKLNNGHYCNCFNISLIVMNLERTDGMWVAEQFYKAYNEIKTQFTKHFNFIYFITTNGIYKCDDIELKKYKSFSSDMLNQLVNQMHQDLSIGQYEKGKFI